MQRMDVEQAGTTEAHDKMAWGMEQESNQGKVLRSFGKENIVSNHVITPAKSKAYSQIDYKLTRQQELLTYQILHDQWSKGTIQSCNS